MTDLKGRFDGDANKARVIEALERQSVILGNKDLAAKVAEYGQPKYLETGENLITQGEWGDEVYFILAGEFEVLINGRLLRRRGRGMHAGELSGINPGRPRTATLRASQPSIVIGLPMSKLRELTAGDGEFWMRIMDTVATRLDERNELIGKINEIPRVFVISSSETKDVVAEVFKQLDGDTIAVDTWDQGTFGISDYPISSLMDRIEESDFTLSVLGADDILISRGEVHQVTRDNVHLEYGISLGLLGRRRSVLLVCADDKIKLPSDTAGLTTLRYHGGNADLLRRSLRRACGEMKDLVELEGPFQDRRAARS